MDKWKEWMFPEKSRKMEGKIPKRYQAMMERPKFPKRDLAQMLEDLTGISPEEWGIYAFSRDPLKARLKDEERTVLAKEAIVCGQAYAKQVAKEYNSADPLLILQKMGVKTQFADIPSNTDRVLFAEFMEPDEVFVYLDAVNKGERLLGEERIRKVLAGGFNLRQVLLAHELFHVLEIRYKEEIFTQAYYYPLWKIGPLKNTSKILALGEIAAMAFARELCGLPYSAYVIDVLLLYGYSDNEASGLYEEMMNCTGRTPCPGLSRLEVLIKRTGASAETSEEETEDSGFK